VGVDIACGEGQPLGAPLASGGPYFGFLTCKMDLVRQMPGRIVGRTVDQEGKEGFCLTLQAREQHIRRAKAKSNICTNQGLLVTAAAIYLSLMGPEGLRRVALNAHKNMQTLSERLQALSGVSFAFDTPYMYERVLRLNKPVVEVLSHCREHKILAGYDLSLHYPELGNCILVCTTETKTEADLNHYVSVLKEAL